MITLSMLMLRMSGGAEGGSGNLVRQALYLLTIGAGLIGARVASDLRTLVNIPFSILAVIAWCWISVSWAIDPGTSVRRLILTTLMFLGIFVNVNALGFTASYRMILRSLLLLVGISFLAAVLLPGIGVHQQNEYDSLDLIGNWQGIFGHKNYAGAIVAVLILMLFFKQDPMNGWLRLAAMVLSAVFLYKTQSKTSIGLVFVSIASGWLVAQYSLRQRELLMLTYIIFWIAFPVTVWWNWSDLSGNFTAADSFTGRGQIWPAMVGFHQDNWLGAGFASFWNISSANPILPYVPFKSYIETIQSGHNGYLDLLVTVSPIGVVLCILGLIAMPIGRILWSPYVTRQQAGLVLAVIVFAAGNNMTETSLMDRDSPVHILLITFIAMLCSAIKAGKEKAARVKPLLGAS